jgi:hypothetical protein
MGKSKATENAAGRNGILTFDPREALLLGLNEAIALQQMRYWSARPGRSAEERRWIFNSYAQWQEQFPFWSRRTIARTLARLEELGLIVSELRDAGESKYFALAEAADGPAPPDNLSCPPDNLAGGTPGQLVMPPLTTCHALNEQRFLKEEEITPNGVIAGAAGQPPAPPAAAAGPADESASGLFGDGTEPTGVWGEEDLQETAQLLLDAVSALAKSTRQVVSNPRRVEAIAAGLRRALPLPDPGVVRRAVLWLAGRPWAQDGLLNLARWTRREAWVNAVNRFLREGQPAGAPRRGPAPRPALPEAAETDLVSEVVE